MLLFPVRKGASLIEINLWELYFDYPSFQVNLIQNVVIWSYSDSHILKEELSFSSFIQEAAPIV